MKKPIALTFFLLLSAFATKAQDGPSPDSKLHRDFPQTQLLRPSDPPWHYNFETRRWERDEWSYGLIESAQINSLKMISNESLRLLRDLRSPTKFTRHRRHRKYSRRRRQHRTLHQSLQG